MVTCRQLIQAVGDQVFCAQNPPSWPQVSDGPVGDRMLQVFIQYPLQPTSNMFLPSPFNIFTPENDEHVTIAISEWCCIVFFHTNLEAVVWAVGRSHWFTLNTINRIFSKPLRCTSTAQSFCEHPNMPQTSSARAGSLRWRDGEDQRGLDVCWGWSGRRENQNWSRWLCGLVLPFVRHFP